jgi:hypothetical protein
MKYCMICPEYQKKETSAGLMHQLVWVAGLYNKCKNEGLIPIIPNLILTGGHNNGSQKLLADYIDFPADFVNDTPPEDTIIYRYSPWPQIAKTIRTYCPFKEPFKAIAKTIVDQMPKPICCVRIRRTDMLLVRPQTDLTVQDINKVLSKHTYASVYIMTDEKDKDFFNGIEKKYQAFNFPELAGLTDNYELFSIECCIRDICDIRIGMFSMHDDTEYYHDYMCDIKGVH